MPMLSIQKFHISAFQIINCCIDISHYTVFYDNSNTDGRGRLFHWALVAWPPYLALCSVFLAPAHPIQLISWSSSLSRAESGVLQLGKHKKVHCMESTIHLLHIFPMGSFSNIHFTRWLSDLRSLCTHTYFVQNYFSLTVLYFNA